MMEIVDILGIGFGPSNLAIAIALQGQQANHDFKFKFLEKKNNFSWHKNMLLPKATMQISFLKDLVTQYNPCSYYSFLNYLNHKNRLDKFINLKEFFIKRTEFHDYLTWVAEHFSNFVNYNSSVINIKEFSDSLIEIMYLDNANQMQKIYTQNLICGTGLQPNIPEKFSPISDNSFHNFEFLEKIQNYETSKKYNFAIIGSGQSSAEIVEYLYDNYKKSNIHVLQNKFAYKPADDSKFINEIFYPSNVDNFFDLDIKKRAKILNEHKDTNYGVVDIDLIDNLYQSCYDDCVNNMQRIFFHNLQEITSVNNTNDKISIFNQNNLIAQCDCLILCTGYTSNFSKKLLQQSLLSSQAKVDRTCKVINEEVVNKNYKIYIQGESEQTHGLSDSLLSVLAIRSQEIAHDIFKCSLK